MDAEGNPYLILRSDEASESNVIYRSSTIGFWGMSMSVGTETLSVKGRTRGVQLVFASEEEIDDFISVIVQAKKNIGKILNQSRICLSRFCRELFNIISL